MQIDSTTLITILGMALVTYATRVGGLVLMRHVSLSAPIERWLRYVPGAVLVSLVAPTITQGGLATVLATVATIVVFARSNSVVLAMVTGIGVVWLLRLW